MQNRQNERRRPRPHPFRFSSTQNTQKTCLVNLYLICRHRRRRRRHAKMNSRCTAVATLALSLSFPRSLSLSPHTTRPNKYEKLAISTHTQTPGYNQPPHKCGGAAADPRRAAAHSTHKTREPPPGPFHAPPTHHPLSLPFFSLPHVCVHATSSVCVTTPPFFFK